MGFSVGGFLTPQIGLGGTSKGLLSYSDPWFVGAGITAPVIRYYFSEQADKLGFFVEAGVGIGHEIFVFSVLPSSFALGPAAIAGVGIEIPREKVKILLFLDGTAAILSQDELLTALQVGVGFSFYSSTASEEGDSSP